MIRYVLISALLVVAVYSFTIEDENEDTFLEEAKEELDPEEERRIALPPGAVCNGHKSDCQCLRRPNTSAAAHGSGDSGGPPSATARRGGPGPPSRSDPAETDTSGAVEEIMLHDSFVNCC
uniref:U33-Lycotoxin-Lsp1n_1 n=1 Tax=Lycosa sp. SGP-2016 TaxID=1905177 RepID=A0A482Z7T1_9ARAC